MKRMICSIAALILAVNLAACSIKPEHTAQDEKVPSTSETAEENEVLKFFADKYDMMLKLWGPEGQDLYAFYIYPDHAERECHILMPANTDDVAEYHKNLSWEIVDDELIITGEWQERFKIDISNESATSTTTGKVYQIYDLQQSLE